MPSKKEIARKLFHLPGLLFLFAAQYHRWLSVSALLALTFFYGLSCFLENRNGKGLPGIAALTHRLKREGKWDFGPPLLAVGIALSLILFPYRAAACGILLVCIADGAASVAGKYWGRRKLFYSPQKSYWGSFAFLSAAFFVLIVFLPWKTALPLAFAGTLLESLPFGAWDNLIIPLGVAGLYQVLGRLSVFSAG
ncbi:MAG: SEC59/DGK1/VTE5 family protein [bacterium]